MGIETPESLGFFPGEVPPTCFYCGKLLSNAFIFWMGDGTSIAMHGACANDLAAHLLSDAAKLRLGDRP